jgi:precorrin-3B synthase
MNRRGACPTLTAPMATGDGLLVRLALERPGVSPATLTEIARAAADHGNGLIDVSARGNIQIRGLSAASLPALAARIEALDILAPDHPAIAVNPLAGVDPAIEGDPRTIARTLRALIAACRPALTLAPKMTIVIDGGGALPLDALVADIRLVAAGNRWSLALAGDASASVPLGMVDEGNAAQAVLLLLALLARHGSHMRARDLLDQAGPGPFQAALAAIPLAPPHAIVIRPPVPDVGRHALDDAQQALGIALPFGQIGAASLIRLAQAADRLEAKSICPAPGRALLVTGLSADHIDTMTESATALGMIVDPTDPRLGIAACTGKLACASAHFDTRAVARHIAAHAPTLVTDRRQVHISGCAKGCARASAAETTIVGRADGIGVVIDGRADAIPFAVLPHLDPAALLARITLLESKI